MKYMNLEKVHCSAKGCDVEVDSVPGAFLVLCDKHKELLREPMKYKQTKLRQ